MRVEISGAAAALDPKGQSIALSAASPDETNSITEPDKIVPVSSPIDGFSATFTRTFPPYSITSREKSAIARETACATDAGAVFLRGGADGLAS